MNGPRNEFRQDPASGDWVIIAPGRADRPDNLKKKSAPRKPSPKSTCPFEHPEDAGPLPANWRVAVIPNKYPALIHGEGCSVAFRDGMYHAQTAVGRHELVITRDHNKNFAELAPAVAAEVMRTFQERHRAAAEEACITYVTTFFNWGASVGGSIWHPHYQVMALPVIPPHATHSLQGAEAYFKENRRCVRCDMVKEERKQKKRIIAENEYAIAFTPYASKRPFEVSVIPKKHQPSFRDASPKTLAGTAAVLQSVLRRLKRNAGDPDLNFFIHEAPLNGKKYPYAHWHIEVMPNISRMGGFEYSTGIFINVMDPDVAAKILKNA